MAEHKRLPSVELPDDEEEHSFFLNYNGEPAYAIAVDNEVIEREDKPRIISRLTVTTMPIEGGDGQQATVTLYEKGK